MPAMTQIHKIWMQTNRNIYSVRRWIWHIDGEYYLNIESKHKWIKKLRQTLVWEWIKNGRCNIGYMLFHFEYFQRSSIKNEFNYIFHFKIVHQSDCKSSINTICDVYYTHLVAAVAEMRTYKWFISQLTFPYQMHWNRFELNMRAFLYRTRRENILIANSSIVEYFNN